MNEIKKVPVSIIIPMRNSSTTVLKTLDSLEKQTYPIGEIIVIDNLSKDNSVEIAKSFLKKTKIPVSIIRRTEDRGVGSSYNLGAKKAKFPLLVFMHSDSELPTGSELAKLVKPIIEDKNTVASYSIIILPESIWETYNFWQKCLFSRAVGIESPGLNGKFDCIRKDVFLQIGGFDEKNWNKNAGGEDADLHMKLKSVGEVVQSKAKIVHLHYLGNNFSINDLLKTKKQLARTYGRLIRVRGKDLTLGAFAFGIKPILAVFPLLPHLHMIGLLLLFVYSILYTKKMFVTGSILRDPRILLLPFINIYLVYYETFWMAKTFFVLDNKK